MEETPFEVMERYGDALKMIAGIVDSCGYTHGSVLIDAGDVSVIAALVFEGKTAHEALEEV